MTLVAIAATVWVLADSGRGSGGLDASGPECVVLAGTAEPAATVGLSGTLLAGEAGGALADADALSLAAVQLQHAATINAVGLRLDLPARARVIALATALQESSLRNLPDGDRDSLGLFQQRPSQGWGTVEQISDPVYSAEIFYDRLLDVPGWAELPLTRAAQTVQQSGFPDAYAKWEAAATRLATGLTGAPAVRVNCRAGAVEPTSTSPDRTALVGSEGAAAGLASFLATAQAELGGLQVGSVAADGASASVTVAVPGLDSADAAATLAALTVAHTTRTGIAAVEVGDQGWAPGAWHALDTVHPAGLVVLGGPAAAG